MIKRALSIIILVSMILHCANRLGVLSYLYSYRSEIAMSLGLTGDDESIAVCDGSYYQGQTLLIQNPDEGHKSPPLIILAQEINLFVASIITIPTHNQLTVGISHKSQYLLCHCVASLTPVFHPPSLA